MIGALLVMLAVLVVLPAVFLLLGLVFSALFGWVAKTNAEATHEDSELIDLNY